MSDLLAHTGRLLTPITAGAKRAVVILFALTMTVGAANLLFTSREVGQLRGVVRTQDAQARVQAAQVAALRTAVLASCAFAADLGGVPVPAAPRPSKLGISLVADSRQQWRKLGCPGHLAPPQPTFVHWANFYRLPAG